jgi:hypothetical protein
MKSGSVVSFLLVADGNVTGVCESVEEAKKLAEQYMANTHSLRIESGTQGSVIGPSLIWNFDYKTRSWITRR